MPMNEALLVDLLTLRPYRDQLLAEDATAEEWDRYRAWRARVLASVSAATTEAAA